LNSLRTSYTVLRITSSGDFTPLALALVRASSVFRSMLVLPRQQSSSPTPLGYNTLA
jgi:hypothetical protein